MSDYPEYSPYSGGVRPTMDVNQWEIDAEVNDTEDFWPSIKKRLEDTNNWKRFIIPCTICLSNLYDSAHPEKTPRDGDGPRVTPCGHVFCLRCLREHWRSQEEMGVKRSCPTCRQRLECETCDQKARVWKAPMWQHMDTWINIRESKTLPEGGTLMSQCSECVEHSRWVRRVLRNETDMNILADGRVMTRKQRLGMQALSSAAKLCEAEGLETHTVEDLFNGLIRVAIRGLESDALARSKKRHYRDRGRSTAEWMRVGTRKSVLDNDNVNNLSAEDEDDDDDADDEE